VVVAAGNNGNLPYVVGSPSIGPGVISVAQTQVPAPCSIPCYQLASVDYRIYKNTATVDWAPIGNGFTGNVVAVGRGCPAGSIALEAWRIPTPTARF